jgi:hypothetical protein
MARNEPQYHTASDQNVRRNKADSEPAPHVWRLSTFIHPPSKSSVRLINEFGDKRFRNYLDVKAE